MKRVLTSLLLIAGIAGPFVGRLAAQTNLAVADVPFSFVAENKTMPAGRYTVTQLSPGNPVFTLRSFGGPGTNVRLGTQQSRNSGHPSLTFACYGKACVLAKVTPPEGPVSYALGTDSVERKLAHKIGVVSMVAVKVAAR